MDALSERFLYPRNFLFVLKSNYRYLYRRSRTIEIVLKGKVAVLLGIVITLSILAVISEFAVSSSHSVPDSPINTTSASQGQHFALELSEGLDVQSSP